MIVAAVFILQIDFVVSDILLAVDLLHFWLIFSLNAHVLRALSLL